MMRLEQFLADHLREVLAEQRVLTVFDPARRLLETARSLAGEHCLVIEVSDDLITARERALEALAELGRDPTHTSQLVLYVPRERPLDAEAVCLDPFTPVVLAGGVFPDGAGDSYLALCQRFLPEQAGVFAEMFQHGEPTLAEINSLVAGAEGAPVLSGLLGAEGTKEVLVRFLCLSSPEAQRLKSPRTGARNCKHSSPRRWVGSCPRTWPTRTDCDRSCGVSCCSVSSWWISRWPCRWR